MFDDRLKKLRIENGLNKKEAAKELGLAYTTYIGYENDEREPNSEVLLQIADYYNCTIDYLLGREEDGDLIASLRKDLLDYCDGDVTKALMIQNTIDNDAMKENASIAADADVPITSTERNKQRINALFDKLTTEQQENVIGRAETFAELNDSNDSATTKNKTHTFPIAAYGGDNEGNRGTEDQLARAIKAANKLDKKKLNGK